MDVLGIFREEANRMLRDAGVNLGVEYAKEGFGDFTLPCFPLAKEMKKNPAIIAKEIAEKLEGGEYFKKIEAVGPYINFHISPVKLASLTLDAVLSGDIFRFEPKGKVILEHTSANPTGPLHVGRARNPIIGDTMARILREYGHEVEVHYYVNDAGLQVATLLWGLKNLFRVMKYEDKKCDHLLVPYYQDASRRAEESAEVMEDIRALMRRYEDGDEELREFAREKIGCMLEGIRETLERIGVHVDKFVWESEFIPLAREIARKLEDVVEEEDGAYYVDLRKIGVEMQKNKFFLYRRDGTTLYFLRDIAYHIAKGKEASYLVDVLGEDHKLHFQALKSVVTYLDSSIDMRALFYSFVRLPEGKMSTRRGTVVYLDDLLDEGYQKALEVLKDRDYTEEEARRIAEGIAVSSIRYSILNVQEEKPITFRWDRALSFEGESAPFIIYTYARASSIMRKGEWSGAYDPALLEHPQEFRLLKLMAMYHEVIRNSAEKLSPYFLARYAYDLAMQFNQFYRDCPVLSSSADLKESRMALVEAFRVLMKRVLENLGLVPLEKM